ncbi:MAG: hypothetical protein NC043_04315 [Muribaculaceae bacterium]|nr:hypothetical protein [Muribaculaceae bacterium]
MIVPEPILRTMPPEVVSDYRYWSDFMESRITFFMPDSRVHNMDHCERVLLHALLIGHEMFPADTDAHRILALASVFHDTRRLDEYTDRGHGARGALYYTSFCREDSEVTYYKDAVLAMEYHDIDDASGRKAIRMVMGAGAERAISLYEAFKDADALDRWRLGRIGLDPSYLRTPCARKLVDFGRMLVECTVPAHILDEINEEVMRSVRKHGWQ